MPHLRARNWPVRLALLAFALNPSLLACSSVQAASYSVSPQGSNSNFGTSLIAPLRTIANAVQLAGTGDQIVIRGGTYREMIDLSSLRGGSPGAPLTISDYKDEPVLIKGSDPVTDGTLDHGAVWKASWSTNSQEPFANGKFLEQIGADTPFQTELFNTNDGSGKPDYRLPAVGKGVGDLVPGSFTYDAAARILYCEMPDQSNPNRELMEASVRPTVITGSGKSYLLLHGLALIGCDGTASGDYTGVVQLDGSH